MHHHNLVDPSIVHKREAPCERMHRGDPASMVRVLSAMSCRAPREEGAMEHTSVAIAEELVGSLLGSLLGNNRISSFNTRAQAPLLMQARAWLVITTVGRYVLFVHEALWKGLGLRAGSCKIRLANGP